MCLSYTLCSIVKFVHNVYDCLSCVGHKHQNFTAKGKIFVLMAGRRPVLEYEKRRKGKRKREKKKGRKKGREYKRVLYLYSQFTE